jgi:hypothetical protein
MLFALTWARSALYSGVEWIAARSLVLEKLRAS